MRVRPHLLATLRERLAPLSAAELAATFERVGLPFAPIRKPEDLYDDPHLVATGFFAIEEHPSEGAVRTMRMPLSWSDSTAEPPRPAPRHGEHSVEVLRQAGYGSADIDHLIAQGVVQQAAPTTTTGGSA